jgi:hypothetical protein
LRPSATPLKGGPRQFATAALQLRPRLRRSLPATAATPIIVRSGRSFHPRRRCWLAAALMAVWQPRPARRNSRSTRPRTRHSGQGVTDREPKKRPRTADMRASPDLPCWPSAGTRTVDRVAVGLACPGCALLNGGSGGEVQEVPGVEVGHPQPARTDGDVDGRCPGRDRLADDPVGRGIDADDRVRPPAIRWRLKDGLGSESSRIPRHSWRQSPGPFGGSVHDLGGMSVSYGCYAPVRICPVTGLKPGQWLLRRVSIRRVRQPDASTDRCFYVDYSKLRAPIASPQVRRLPGALHEGF